MNKTLLIFTVSLFSLMLYGAENSKADNSVKENTESSSSATKEPVTQCTEQADQIKPGEWIPLFDTGLCIFPSMVISTATINVTMDNAEQMQPRSGDWWGTVGIAVCSPRKDCPVKVEISGNTYIKPSKYKVTLPEANLVYLIYPPLIYEYDKLLRIEQTTPENISIKVTIDKNEPDEEAFRFQVRPINDCVFYYVNAEGEELDVGYFFAAYVNENHPGIEKILQECLKAGKVDSFAGYYKTPEEVKSEIKAIWDTLAQKGIRYSSVNTTSGEDEKLASTHIRLLGETLNNTQANCADGSVMFASILRKLGLDVSLVLIPGHMFLYVNLDPEGNNFICIETTMIGTSSFEDAVEEGNQEFKESEKKFNPNEDDNGGYQIINIAYARRMGIMPIKEITKKNHEIQE